MKSPCHRIVGGIIAILVCVGLLTVCDDRDQQQAQREQARREAQIQAQLQAEAAKAQIAQQAARQAEASRNAWLTAIGTGACAACIIVLLIGIHIGSRALARCRKDHPHG